MDRCQNLTSFLDWAQHKLLQAEVASPRLDAEVLMAESLNISRTELMTYPDRVLSRIEAENFCSRIERRVLREPVSHITGVQEFWSLEFSVNEKVLTPRPETEILVEQCLKALARKSSPVRILDLGTGSGILAIVLAKEIPQSQIMAIDKSTLEVARKNALRHAVADQVCFVSADLMQADWQGPYHLIVSNPPYIESENLFKCMPEVRQYEPVQALDGGRDGLDYYRFIVPSAWEKLEDDGLLALEIGHTQAAAVVALMESGSGYQDIQVVQDYSGYDRVVLARKRILNG
ncbi:MAG: peptide chain release factor N(5)-glutamine methyltransferase [Nitrospinae bacterium]|nr:peptide chain release factor N(5)-glutamine methyltransferase [Nitrospinota bacterium]MBL7019640.1 peptide chain release factor N(5)-glutamine methyltransferase [Nitrospinaceae bacterium]